MLYFTNMAAETQMTTRKRKLADLKSKETSLELQTERPHELHQPDEDIRTDEASANKLCLKDHVLLNNWEIRSLSLFIFDLFLYLIASFINK